MIERWIVTKESIAKDEELLEQMKADLLNCYSIDLEEAITNKRRHLIFDRCWLKAHPPHYFCVKHGKGFDVDFCPECEDDLK